MPRFFFDVRVNDIFLPDEEGLEFADSAVAEKEAAIAAAEIKRDLLLKGTLSTTVAVEVRSESGQRLAVATASSTLERFDSPAEAPTRSGQH